MFEVDFNVSVTFLISVRIDLAYKCIHSFNSDCLFTFVIYSQTIMIISFLVDPYVSDKFLKSYVHKERLYTCVCVDRRQSSFM